jgi:hypothetical protein
MSQQTFTDLLKHSFAGISKEIKWCLRYNQGFSFDTKNFGERVLFITENTKGVPSNGGCAFDSEIGTEGKGCFSGQTYICTECKLKNNYYSDKCYNCGSTGRKDPGDTRWGIDCRAHFKYKNQIPSYVVTHIQPLNMDVDNPKYRIRVFRIDSKNEMFNKILSHQLEHGKSTKNLMPFKRDFYMSYPIPLVDCTVDIHEDDVNVEYDFYHPENDEPLTQVPMTAFGSKEKSILKQEMPILPDKMLIDEAVRILGVKQSTHGKQRGVLDRNKNLA